jgi:hypothetical protein
MPPSADTLNTKSELGRNATPISVIEAARYVLGGTIELDVASDSVINEAVQAERIYTIEQDGYSQGWRAKTLWMNPPGRSYTLRNGQKIQVTAAKWFRKLHRHWKAGDVEHAIALCYRGGSVGCLGVEMLQLPLCITAAGAPQVNGAGRLSFEIIDDNGLRQPEVANTQSSVLVLLSRDTEIISRFQERFAVFGVVRT